MENQTLVNANRLHYNSITDAWRYIFGENFHWGFFRSEEENLEQASANLIDELARSAHFSPLSNVLDVGCGIGGPARYLYEKYHCHITGISTSEKGIETGSAICRQKGYDEHIRFQVADALDNGFPDSSFDIVWVMESSHLMRDKTQLLRENFRVLKPGGTLLLCDNMISQKLTEERVIALYKQLRILEQAFGKVQLETLEFYRTAAGKAGFSHIETRDISSATFPTIRYFRENIELHRYQILHYYFSLPQLDIFLSACEVLEAFTQQHILSYGMLHALKE